MKTQEEEEAEEDLGGIRGYSTPFITDLGLTSFVWYVLGAMLVASCTYSTKSHATLLKRESVAARWVRVPTFTSWGRLLMKKNASGRLPTRLSRLGPIPRRGDTVAADGSWPYLYEVTSG